MGYKGQWVDGDRHGHGTMRYRDGGIYEGQWVDDYRHGYGTMRYDEDWTYVGKWDTDKPKGWSKIKKDRDNLQYVLKSDDENGSDEDISDEKKNNIPNGEGIMYYYSDGRRY